MTEYQEYQQALRNFAHQAQAIIDAEPETFNGVLKIRLAEAKAGKELYWGIMQEVEQRYALLAKADA